MTFTLYGVTFDLYSKEAIEMANFVVSMEKAKKDIEAFKGLIYGSKECSILYHELYKVLSENLDRASYESRFECFYNDCYHDYFLLCAIEEEKYREYAEADFLEYASHKNEPNFDWGYYSDWHKDLYGFRPRR